MTGALSLPKRGFKDMPKSLQQIEDYYISKGLAGEALRQALDKDEEFQTQLKEWREQVRNKYGVTESEENTYYLPKQEDYEILAKVKQLESVELNEHDRELVEVIKAQLLAEWRRPLLEKLEYLLEKYN